MTTPTLTDRLARLHNRPTRYELAATHADGRKVLIAYSPRRNRQGLLAAARERGELLVKLAGTDSITFAKLAAGGATMGAWSIKYTGRTQREAYTEGELPYIGDVPEAK